MWTLKAELWCDKGKTSLFVMESFHRRLLLSWSFFLGLLLDLFCSCFDFNRKARIAGKQKSAPFHWSKLMQSPRMVQAGRELRDHLLPPCSHGQGCLSTLLKVSTQAALLWSTAPTCVLLRHLCSKLSWSSVPYQLFTEKQGSFNI